MKKVLICSLLVLISLLCISAHAEQDGLYTYELNDDMTVTITGFDWANNHGDIYIPEMLGNRMVSAIGDNAFATTGNDAVSITLPDGIKSIGALAFRGVAIKYVNIPLNTTQIGDGAFCQCPVMQFRVAEGHPVFATIDNALYNKTEKKLIAWPENKEISPIPHGIKSIGGYVFYGRKIHEFDDISVEARFLPDTLTIIGPYAFAEGKFTGFLHNVSEIGEYAFFRSSPTYNENNPEVIFHDKELSLSKIGSHAFENNTLGFGNKKISSTPFEIGDYAFYNALICWASTPDDPVSLCNVTSIGDYAFQSKEHNIYWIGFMPSDFSKLSFIGEGAFNNGSLSGSVDFASLKTISSSAFATDKSSELTKLMEVSTGEVTEISDKAFKGQSSLKNVQMNENLLSIGSEAFMGCTSLTEVSIPASVNYIGDNVFASCSDKLVIIVEAGSYGEVWARTCGYAYKVNGKADDTSWLDD